MLTPNTVSRAPEALAAYSAASGSRGLSGVGGRSAASLVGFGSGGLGQDGHPAAVLIEPHLHLGARRLPGRLAAGGLALWHLAESTPALIARIMRSTC